MESPLYFIFITSRDFQTHLKCYIFVRNNLKISYLVYILFVLQKFRKAISCHYAAAECEVIDINGTPHTDVSKSIEATAAKGAGIPIDFAVSK